jgi:hypothetical protein
MLLLIVVLAMLLIVSYRNNHILKNKFIKYGVTEDGGIRYSYFDSEMPASGIPVGLCLVAYDRLAKGDTNSLIGNLNAFLDYSVIEASSRLAVINDKQSDASKELSRLLHAIYNHRQKYPRQVGKCEDKQVYDKASKRIVVDNILAQYVFAESTINASSSPNLPPQTNQLNNAKDAGK